MRIYFCREGLNSIMALLQRELPDDQVLCCAPDKVVETSREADVLIPTVSPVTAEAIASPQLKLVQQYGAGLDTVDIPAATKRGIYVANVPSAGTGNAESVADYVSTGATISSGSRRVTATQIRDTAGRLTQRADSSHCRLRWYWTGTGKTAAWV
jgi:phosphoglycerate dehydrogenase-like enzyme